MAAVPLLQLIANETLAAFFERAALINSVTRDFIENAVAEKGESVTVLTPESPDVEDADATFSANDVSPDSVKITLDSFKRTAPFKIGDKVNSMAHTDLATIYGEPMADSLVKYVEGALMTAAATLTGTVGASGTAPTGVGPLGTDIWAKFESMSLPVSNRNVVLAPTAAGEWLKVFGSASIAGTAGVQSLTSGIFLPTYGITYRTSPLVPSTVAGIAFNKSALALALRAPKITDPANQAVAMYKGLGVRITKWVDHKDAATYMKADVLFGVKKLNERGFLILK